MIGPSKCMTGQCLLDAQLSLIIGFADDWLIIRFITCGRPHTRRSKRPFTIGRRRLEVDRKKDVWQENSCLMARQDIENTCQLQGFKDISDLLRFFLAAIDYFSFNPGEPMEFTNRNKPRVDAKPPDPISRMCGRCMAHSMQLLSRLLSRP